mgnify:CR=1 FL=1
MPWFYGVGVGTALALAADADGLGLAELSGVALGLAEAFGLGFGELLGVPLGVADGDAWSSAESELLGSGLTNITRTPFSISGIGETTFAFLNNIVPATIINPIRIANTPTIMTTLRLLLFSPKDSSIIPSYYTRSHKPYLH